MTTMTATDVARNFRAVLDRLAAGDDEIAIMRNNHLVAKLVPGAPKMTAMEAFADLYGVLDDDQGERWLHDAGKADATLRTELRDPWA